MNYWKGIVNRNILSNHGSKGLRCDSLEIIEYSIRKAIPYQNTIELIQFDNQILKVGNLEYDLRDRDSIFVIGAGKASQPIAKALEEILGTRIKDGCIAIKEGEEIYLDVIPAIHAGHPIPNKNSIVASNRILDICCKAGKKDLVFSIITGGSSSLVELPKTSISLEDIQKLNILLLNCGASIREINAVRKHVSQIKGGRLGVKVFPAELINLTVSDVIGDPIDFISDLTVPDTSTWDDAISVIEKYQLWEELPASVSRIIKTRAGGGTVKKYTGKYHNFMLLSGDSFCQAAIDKCKSMGYITEVMTLEMNGESRKCAEEFISYAKSTIENKNQAGKFAVIAGGETIVTVGEPKDAGGPNQEFALRSAIEIAGNDNVIVAAVASDGTDGPTNACGALVDGETIKRSQVNGLDPYEALNKHASNKFLEILGDLVITGPTGTNVNDCMLYLAVV